MYVDLDDDLYIDNPYVLWVYIFALGTLIYFYSRWSTVNFFKDFCVVEHEKTSEQHKFLGILRTYFSVKEVVVSGICRIVWVVWLNWNNSVLILLTCWHLKMLILRMVHAFKSFFLTQPKTWSVKIPICSCMYVFFCFCSAIYVLVFNWETHLYIYIYILFTPG